MDTNLLFFIFNILIILMGVVMFFAQEKFVRSLYRNHRELWERLGGPGGLFWCPEGRRFWKNFMITRRFWYENQFGLATSITLPDEVRSSYSVYIKLLSSMFIVFVLFILSLLWLQFYEAGVSPSDVTPSQ